MLKAFGRMFEIYRKINNYVNSKNIKIVNLTEGGGLDVFERDKLENIIKIKVIDKNMN